MSQRGVANEKLVFFCIVVSWLYRAKEKVMTAIFFDSDFVFIFVYRGRRGACNEFPLKLKTEQ